MSEASMSSYAALADELIRVEKLVNHFRTRGSRSQLMSPYPDVELGSFPVLFQLARGPARVSAIADCGLSDVSTVSRHASNLVEAGLVDKVPDPDDGRAQLLRLTDAGADLVGRLRARRNAWIAAVVADWPEADVAVFTTLMNRFADDLQRTYDSWDAPAESERTPR